MPGFKTLWKAVDRVSALVVIVAGGFLAWHWAEPYVRSRMGTRGPQPSSSIANIADAATLGEESAQAGMIIFSCFECPYSARFAREVWPEVRGRMVETGDLLVAFRNLPLPGHPNALKAAQSAECSRRQGQFWAVHDRLFSGEVRLERPNMWVELTRLGLNMDEFKQCVSGPVSEKIDEEMRLAEAFGVEKTPAFAIGKVRPDGGIAVNFVLQGFQTFASIQGAVRAVR